MGQTEPGERGGRRWYVLDIGEVLIDETRVWSVWADVLGVPRFTLMATLGGAVARGGDYRTALDLLGVPDWREREPRAHERYGAFRSEDLYVDALSTIAALRGSGFGVAVIGNQPARRGEELRALGVEADVIAMSEELGVEKPDPAFFAEVLRLVGATPESVAYVGDRVDNDVLPSLAAGLRAVWLRRGPWGALHTLPAGLAEGLPADLAEGLPTAAGVTVVRTLDELAAVPQMPWRT